MKKLLAAGDSLLAGRYGKSPLDFSREISRFQLINRGQDGEPMAGILRNLEVHLRSNTPQILLMDGGANDLLIPYMRENHPEEWIPFLRKMERHGSIAAASLKEYSDTLKRAIKLCEKFALPFLILLTIPVICEDFSHPLHRAKKEMDQEIRRIASEGSEVTQIILADFARVMDDALTSRQPGSPWLFRSPQDLENDRTASPSPDRGLVYTTDGVHLNEQGAALCGEELDKILSSLPA